MTIAGCNYTRATRTSCCYFCWNVWSNHYRISQRKSLSNVWFSLCLPACRVFLGLCVKLQTCRVITLMWENLQCKREASTAISFFLRGFCAKYQPVFCRLLLCSSDNVLLFVSYFDGWLQPVLRQTGLPGRRKTGLHVSYFLKRSFIWQFLLFQMEEEESQNHRLGWVARDF